MAAKEVPWIDLGKLTTIVFGKGYDPTILDIGKGYDPTNTGIPLIPSGGSVVIMPLTNTTGGTPEVVVAYTPPLPNPMPAFSSVVSAERVINFTNTSGNSVSYSWNFGDGYTSTTKNPVHQYTAIGSYTVTLTAKNSSGVSVATSAGVNVTDIAAAANFTYQVAGFVIYFVNASTIYGGVLWDFGDGTTSTDVNPSHTFASNTTYTVKLTVNGYTKQTNVTIDTAITLSWGVVSLADGYKIYWSLDGSTWSLIGTNVGNGVVTFGVSKAGQGVDSAYMNYFRVTAYNTLGESAPTTVTGVKCL